MENENIDMILVTGIPRSGTSWISNLLSYSDKVRYYYEPDNEHNSLLGYIYKQNLHRFPYLRQDDTHNGLYTIFKRVLSDNYIYDYSKRSLIIKKLLNINLVTSELEVLQKCAQNNLEAIAPQDRTQKIRVELANLLYTFFQLFKAYNKNKKVPLIKSVHCLLALPYIQSLFKAKIVIILRHPADIISSHLRIKNPDIDRNIIRQKELVDDYIHPFISKINALENPLEKAGAQVAVFYHILARQMKDNPDWVILKHEDFCLNPKSKFKELYNQLNFDWSDRIYTEIDNLNKKGSAYSNKRISQQEINKWRIELKSSQIDKIRKGYGIIAPSFYKDFIP